MDFLKRHLHPLGGRIIFWNLMLLLVVKLILPHSLFQSATLLESLPAFNSRDVITITNQARGIAGLPPLNTDPKLDLAAEEKLEDMAKNEYFAHVSPSGINPWHWIQDSQYKYSTAGENLAIGFTTAQDTVQAWLNSPSHKANLLNASYQDIGVAVKGVSIDGKEGVLVVQMFGSPHLSYGAAGKPSVLAISLKPTPAPKPFPTTVPQTKGATIAIAQDVSSDRSIAPVEAPQTFKLQEEAKANDLSRLVNNIFAWYAFGIAMVSLFAFFFYERNRNMAYKMAFNVVLFVLAIAVPTTHIYLQGWIF